MQLFFLIAGGGLGAISRFLIGTIVIKVIGKSNVITGAVISNCMGGLLAGLVLTWLMKFPTFSQELTLFLYVGFLGSLTTFSTFALESLLLVKKGALPRLLTYLFVQMIVVLVLTGIGIWAGQWLFGNV